MRETGAAKESRSQGEKEERLCRGSKHDIITKKPADAAGWQGEMEVNGPV